MRGILKDKRKALAARGSSGDQRKTLTARGSSGDQRKALAARGSSGDQRKALAARGSSGDQRKALAARESSGSKRETPTEKEEIMHRKTGGSVTGAADKNSERVDYHTYRFSRKERMQITLIYAALAAAIVWLFYRRWQVLLAAVPIYPLYIRHVRNSRAAARRRQLSYDFRTALNSLAVSLRAGRSVENAFPDAARDLKSTIGEEQDMTQEFIWISRQIRVSVPMETVLLDFAGRSGVEDIENFAAVFTTAKRMGGNMAAILRSAADSIGGKIDVEREIETALAAKKMEQKIMTAMPCMIILYMTFASPGFLDDMYTSAFGALVMTGCLLTYALAVWWSGRIVAIEV